MNETSVLSDRLRRAHDLISFLTKYRREVSVAVRRGGSHDQEIQLSKLWYAYENEGFQPDGFAPERPITRASFEATTGITDMMRGK